MLTEDSKLLQAMLAQEYMWSRVRIYRINPKQAIMFLNWAAGAPEFIEVPTMPACVPAGAVVLGMQSCFNPLCIEVAVHHTTFDEVRPGDMYPRESGLHEITVRRVAIKPE